MKLKKISLKFQNKKKYEKKFKVINRKHLKMYRKKTDEK